MGRSISRKRPWLAALLAALCTGLGHLYLRRWRRALGWLTALVAAAVLFVDPAVLEALANGTPVDPLSTLPLLVVASLSVVDAYLIAQAQNDLMRAVGSQSRVPPQARMDGEQSCPNCGKELDTDLDFCHWCMTEFEDVEEPVGRHPDR